MTSPPDPMFRDGQRRRVPRCWWTGRSWYAEPCGLPMIQLAGTWVCPAQHPVRARPPARAEMRIRAVQGTRALLDRVFEHRGGRPV